MREIKSLKVKELISIMILQKESGTLDSQAGRKVSKLHGCQTGKQSILTRIFSYFFSSCHQKFPVFSLVNFLQTIFNASIKLCSCCLLPSLNVVDIVRTSDIPINTYVDGYAASAATLISVVGANRLINKNGVMLIHQLKMGNEYNKYKEIKDYSYNSDTLMQIIKNIYLEMGKSKNFISRIYLTVHDGNFLRFLASDSELLCN